jgi:Ran GTPase-activating protein (RanGAP) involved in mRNA processing and transport
MKTMNDEKLSFDNCSIDEMVYYINSGVKKSILLPMSPPEAKALKEKIELRLNDERTSLDLSECMISSSCIDHLCSFSFLSEITCLNLRKNFLNGTDLKKVINSEVFKNLTEIDASDNYLNTNKEDLMSCNFDRFKRLDLCMNKLEFKDMKECYKRMKNLTNLNLSGSKIGNEGVEYLSKCNFKSLTHLNLSDNKIVGKEGVDHTNFIVYPIIFKK